MKTPAVYISTQLGKSLPTRKQYGKLRDDLQFIFGIPTVNRKNENYLYETIDSLLNGLNNFETKREPCLELTSFDLLVIEFDFE